MPSEGPAGAALRYSGVNQRVILRDDQVAFILTVASSFPVTDMDWEGLTAGAEHTPAVAEGLSAQGSLAKRTLDVLAGAYALYQYPLVWKKVHERHQHFFIDPAQSQMTAASEILTPDNFLPYRLNPSKKVSEGKLHDEVIAQARGILATDLDAPLSLLLDSMWQMDIRSRFLLQFWIVEWFSAKNSSGSVDSDLKELISHLGNTVSERSPTHLKWFHERKSDLLRRTLRARVKECLDSMRIEFRDDLFGRAKKIRDHLSHGDRYDETELVMMERYVRDLSRLLLRRALELKGVFLTGGEKEGTEPSLLVPSFSRAEGFKVKEAAFRIQHGSSDISSIKAKGRQLD